MSIIDISTLFMRKFDDTIGAIINKTAIRMRLELSSAISEQNIDITVDQYLVLSRLYEKEGWTQSELASLTYKDKSSITRILDLLVKKKYVERRNIENDRRAYEIYLTISGKEIIEKVIEIADKHMKKGIKGLTENEIKQVKDILNKIHDNY